MIFGVGVDIVKVSRMEKWVHDEALLKRFFNEAEACAAGSVQHRAEHYAARFAAKEAFSKALGAGLTGFSLRDVYVKREDGERPILVVQGTALALLEKACGAGASVHISLTHEKEYAVAFVVIETGGEYE